MNETEIDCRSINDLADGLSKCNFLLKNNECLSGESVFDYMYMAFCFVDSTSYYRPIAISGFLFVILFLSLGVTADDFLCPSLLVISKTLGLSQNIAGVTLLAFGNGSPDIFSSLAGINQARPELVIGELFGSGIFVLTVVVGSIFLCKSFTSMKRPILRDMTFYLFACYFAWATVWHGSISFFHALVFILLYIVYLIVVIMGRFVNQKMNKKKEDEKRKTEKLNKSTNGFQYGSVYALNVNKASSQVQRPNARSFDVNLEANNNTIQQTDQSNGNPKSVLITNTIDNKFGIDNPALDVKDSVSLTGRRFSHSVHHHFDNTIYHITHSMDQEDALSCTNPDCNCAQQESNRINTLAPSQTNLNGSKRNVSMVSVLSNQSAGTIPNFDSQSIVSSFANLQDLNEFQDFLVHICPLDFGEWKSLSFFSKIFQLLKAPIYFLLLITVPVIDYENDRQNWCRTLNSIHLITSPMTILYITGTYLYIWESWLFIGITAFICIISSLLVFFKTSNKTVPKFHYLFGFLGFAVSMLWIYAFATETISLLHVIGIMLNLSDFILGLTILAFGNSIGDLMSNVSMARNGFAKMGISACYGGPLFNLLFGIGLPYCILLYKDTTLFLPINYSKIVTLSFGTASFSLLTTMFLLIFSDFRTKKWHGIILLTIYVFYVSTACLIEFNYI